MELDKCRLTYDLLQLTLLVWKLYCLFATVVFLETCLVLNIDNITYGSIRF